MRKARLLLMAGALLAFLSAGAAKAQTSSDTGELLNRLKQIENQIQTMSRAVYRGDKDAMQQMNAVSSSSVSGFEQRLGQIEDQQRGLTGQLEKISFDLQQIKDRMDRLQADTDQRFQQSGSAAPPRGEDLSTTVISSSGAGTLGTLSPSNGHQGPPESMYDGAFANVRAQRYAEAERGFRQFLGEYPGHPLASNAQYWLGETYYVRGDYKQAAKVFAQGYQSFPKGPKAADSLLKLGLSLAKIGKKDDACLSLRQLQKETHEGGLSAQRRAQQEIKQLGCP